MGTIRTIINQLRAIANKPVRLVIVLLASIAFTVLIRYRWREDAWTRIVQSDGSGYYAYLPALLLHQDLQYRFYLILKDKYGFGDLSENFLNTENGKFYNRYFCGTSIVLLPFFVLAWMASVLFGYDIDGHSFLFNCAINIGALFYVLTGIYALSRYLCRHFSKWIVAMSSAAIFLGTNLFNYTVYEPSYSHAYSFAFICYFIYLADISIRNKSQKSYILLALCTGIIILIRPTNGIVLLSIPFIAGSKEKLIDWIICCVKTRNLIPTMLTGSAVISIQSLLYYLQCGSWWVDGYKSESFYFLEPELLNMWFSYRAGVFLWSPVTILSIPGLISLFRANKFRFFSISIFLFINSWLISSWWAWHYSGTFGMRPMVDYMPYMLILLCFSLQMFRSVPLKIVSRVFLCVLLFFGHVLNYQKIRNIIPYDKMTDAKYWYIFMKTDPKYIFDLDEPYRPTLPNPLSKILIKHFAFTPPNSFADIFPAPYDNFRADSSIEYSGFGDKELIRINPKSIMGQDKYYIEIKLKAYYHSLYVVGELNAQFKKEGNTIYSETYPVISPQYETETWNDIRFSFITRKPVGDSDEIVISIKNGINRPVLLQQLEFMIASY